MQLFANLICATNKRIIDHRIMLQSHYKILRPGLMIFQKSIKKFVTALVLSLLLVPFSRYISPLTTIDGVQVYLAYLPMGLLIAMVFIYGRTAIIPLIISSAVTFSCVLHLSFVALASFVFCLIFPIIVCSIIARH